MRIIGKVIGWILFIGSGIYLWIVGTILLLSWWGTLGLLLGIFVPPIDFFIPFIYWFKTGIFPSLYFIIWGIGIFGVIIANLSSIGEVKI